MQIGPVLHSAKTPSTKIPLKLRSGKLRSQQRFHSLVTFAHAQTFTSVPDSLDIPDKGANAFRIAM